MRRVAIELSTPAVGQLAAVLSVLREWQRDAAPMQLHPGDLGWYWQFGEEAVAAALRTWSWDGQLVAIGLLDGPEVLRMTVASEVWHDEAVARQVTADISDPQRGVLPAGKGAVEMPDGTRVGDLLTAAGWSVGEAWTPLRRDLAGPVQHAGLRVEAVESGSESGFTAVHRSAWGTSRFTDALWRVMVTGLPYSDGRCLLGYDDDGVAVAGVTVWSAGPGRPGLLEPMGVHADHRRRGYGMKMSLAAAAELKALGSSSALVCTESARTAAVATDRAAGFQPLAERRDRTRNA